MRAAPGHWVDQVYVSTQEKKAESPSARCHLPLYMQPSGFMPHTAMKASGVEEGGYSASQNHVSTAGQAAIIIHQNEENTTIFVTWNRIFLRQTGL